MNAQNYLSLPGLSRQSRSDRHCVPKRDRRAQASEATPFFERLCPAMTTLMLN
jgi:hypothetical protein